MMWRTIRRMPSVATSGLWFAAASMTILSLGPVAAQEAEIGSRVMPRLQTSDAKSRAQSVVDSHLYAECVVHHRSSQSADYLAITDPAQVSTARQNLGRDIRCNNTQISSEFSSEQRLQIPTDVYRGMIAEALIAARFARSSPPAVALSRVYVSSWQTVSGRVPSVEEMGVCIASIDPQGIKALLETRAESDEELAALRRLGPSMGPCLAANVKLTANRQSIRATLAEALYHRLATTAPLSAASSGKK